MEDIKWNKNKDEILRTLIYVRKSDNIWMSESDLSKKTRIPHLELLAYLHFIAKDGYIEPEDGVLPMHWAATYLGILFVANEKGYDSIASQKEAEILDLKATIDHTKRVALWMAIGTVGLLILESVKFVLVYLP